jgi:cytochrome P450
VHSLAGNFLAVVRDEADRLVNALRGSNGPTRNNLTIGEPTSNDLTNYDLTWPIFSECWHAAVRRIVLGDAARADRALTGQLAKLRDTANWVLFPKRKSVKADYDQRLNTYLARAQAGSLADVISRRAQEGDEHPLDQITHWLFAFDAGAMTTFRTLALLASHAVPRAKAGSDIQSWQNGRADLPYLRACFLDAVRLWPTAPVILREATGTTSLGSAVIAKGAGIIVYVPFFNRDGERLANADRFDPDFWLGRDPAEAYPFVPFSAGPGACPGRHMVALIGAAWLAALLHAGHWTSMTPPQLDPLRPLPGTLDHYAIRLRLSAR